ncbi:alkaline phosphatase family protein [Leekyejoonella antrihumi]|uniref:Phosphoesterase n=1 Tax=Leekyejoonella antrihumi TaxID=1660198 RepID=A0A563E4B5_9MICO|nr:alkaline phosphatase family protein [Leekyejoonella antrihumi]TWP37149.1 phosphoesterase [Leekyejoonella antrihumi]
MAVSGLTAVEHVVVLMLENRSFDHLLGYLYADRNNVSPAGDAFEGLSGQQSCPGSDGTQVSAYQLSPDTTDLYFYPGADPGEGYAATNNQCYGSSAAPPAGAVAPMTGFVTDFAKAITDNTSKGWYVFNGTAEGWIMGCHTPQTLPVLSALAQGFAVCDHWYGSVPTMTMPNRAFVCAGTSQGHLDDATKKFTVGSIFGALTGAGRTWKIYGYAAAPLTKLDFPDTAAAPAANFGHFADFRTDAAAGTLPDYSFLEPSWSSTGNSQHPNYNVALGEQLLLDTYRAVRDGPDWNSTLLIITYDEHGGCYDHVSPPWGATAPDDSQGEFGFDFTRFGPRVPTVLVSPLIPAGTVHRVPIGSVPFDHTSILATIEHRFGVSPLTRRDAAAPDVAGALSLTGPRTDDPLAGVTAPVPPPNPTGLAVRASHLQRVHAELIAEHGGAAAPPASLQTNADYQDYIASHS